MSTNPICIFTGSADSFNLEKTLQNIGWMLSDDFDLHLLTTTTPSNSVSDYFNIFGLEFDSSRCGEMLSIRTYLNQHSSSVIANLTLPPIHGNMLKFASIGTDTTFIHRYSGDRFFEYRPASGIQKGKFFFINNILGRLPVKAADSNIVMGPIGKERLVERGGKNVCILPPPIDANRFEGHEISSGDNLMKSVVFIGRISTLKGIDTLERTIPRILDLRDDLEFVLIGPVERNFSIPAQYRDRVELTGSVPPSEIPSHLSQADLLVHPSLTEGLPRVLGEALLSKTPVIARDVGDISYVTENTFTTDKEFIRMVRNFEDYPLDSGQKFDREELQADYSRFFRRILERHN